MTWRIHQIQHIILAIFSAVIQPHSLGFDGDAAFTLDIHVIKHLIFHFAVTQPATGLNQTVGNGRFTMVDMRDNRKVPDLV